MSISILEIGLVIEYGRVTRLTGSYRVPLEEPPCASEGTSGESGIAPDGGLGRNGAADDFGADIPTLFCGSEA